MTKKEINLRVFQRKEVPYVFFQPRMEPWYQWHKQFNKMPEKYKDKSLLEFYDELDVSMRYTHYLTGMPHPIETKFTEKVKVKEKFDEDKGEGMRVIETPYGELVSRYRLSSGDKVWFNVEFMVKDKDDLKKLRWLYENTVYSFSEEKFDKGSKFIGDRGEPQFYLCPPKSPYMFLAQIWARLQDFIYLLVDAQKEVEDVMKTMDDSYDSLFEEITSSKKVRIVNFGENIDVHYFSPLYFEKYLIPYYEKRANQLKKAGIYTHIHIDGSFKPLLKYLKDLPFDGFEALTPLPQGDVSIEEIKENIGDKILLDGIPAVLFLPTFKAEEFEDCVKKIIKLFHPRLILGISDELPEGAPEESIERVRWVSNYCRKYNSNTQ